MVPSSRSIPTASPARSGSRPLLARPRAIPALCISAALAACNAEHGASGAGAAGASTAPAAAPSGPASSAPQAPAPGRSDPNCAAPLEPLSPKLQLRPARGQLVLGVLAGLKDAGDDNLAHLRALAGELRRRGAELLIADGDLGDNSDAQAELLSALASAELPLLVVAGNREVRTDLDAAEASLRKRGALVFDLSHARVVDLGDALVVGLPGVFERRLLRADGACLYAQSDLDALAAWFDKLPQTAPPALLVAAVPPHGEGAQALDASDGQNVGEPRFIPLLTAARARFGVFGQVWEAGGRALDGQGHPIPAGQPSAQLYLNPGAADHTPWPMNDGSTSRGLAALLTIRGQKASYEVVREPTAEARSP